MESGVGFPFYLSPQVRLDAKLKVVKLVDPGATMQPFYVTAQVFSCGVPMHGVTCSTSEPTAREAGSMRTVWWGHWITLPVQYKDVDRGSYIALKVFDGDNREVASTRVGFFDENRCMREGQQVRGSRAAAIHRASRGARVAVGDRVAGCVVVSSRCWGVSM